MARNRDEVMPLMLGPRNTEAALGVPWRWVRDHARVWGVPILRIDAKSFIRAAEFVPALDAHAKVRASELTDAESEHQELERMRERIRRAG